MKKQLTIVLKVCFVLTTGLVVSACTKRESALKDAAFAGVYTLISVDGKPVPADITHEGDPIQVRSGTFTINADGTCSMTSVFVPASGSEVRREVSANYSKEESTLTMKWVGAGITVGTIQGNTFTMDNEGILFLYRK